MRSDDGGDQPPGGLAGEAAVPQRQRDEGRVLADGRGERAEGARVDQADVPHRQGLELGVSREPSRQAGCTHPRLRAVPFEGAATPTFRSLNAAREREWERERERERKEGVGVHTSIREAVKRSGETFKSFFGCRNIKHTAREVAQTF